MLRFGDKGDAVRSLQRDLNKLGSLLIVDGDFGSGTRDAIPDARAVVGMPGDSDADDALIDALAAVDDPCPALTSSGITFIGRAEVSSAAAYRQQYCHPTWPGDKSGITIGIGYDLQFYDEAGFRADWGQRLPEECITQLLPVLGQVGSVALLATVRALVVPLPAAVGAFVTRSLPKYMDQTRSIYPQFDALNESQRTALVSLVYNRGPRLADRKPDDRKEMRAIQQLLADGDLDAVPEQFESMTRLWSDGGLIKRRKDEAALWRGGFAALML